MFYTAVIVTANLVIASVCALCGNDFWLCLGNSILATVAVIAYDGITAFIIRRLPERWFTYDKKAFSVSRREKKLYTKLGIKKITHLVPELGMFTGFHKDKLQSNNDISYLGRFIMESNYGVVIHLVNAFGGFVIAALPFCGGAKIWVPVYFVNFVLSMLPVFILRNNNYSLFNLHKRANRA